MKLFILFFISVAVFAADITPEPTKVDLNKPVRLFVLDGVPGYASQDGNTFNFVYGGKFSRLTGVGNPPLDIKPITLPLWQSRRPGKNLLEQMSDEQRAFWASVNTEAATLIPLQAKLSQLNLAFNAAGASVISSQAAITREIQKATDNHDTAALSSVANQSRAARMNQARDALDAANKALATWAGSPDHVTMMDSQQHMVALWAPTLNPTERKNP